MWSWRRSMFGGILRWGRGEESVGFVGGWGRLLLNICLGLDTREVRLIRGCWCDGVERRRARLAVRAVGCLRRFGPGLLSHQLPAPPFRLGTRTSPFRFWEAHHVDGNR